jgi:hypothetical protein
VQPQRAWLGGRARRFRYDTRQHAPSDLRLAFTRNLRQHLVSVYGVSPAHGRPGDTWALTGRVDDARSGHTKTIMRGSEFSRGHVGAVGFIVLFP